MGVLLPAPGGRMKTMKEREGGERKKYNKLPPVNDLFNWNLDITKG